MDYVVATTKQWNSKKYDELNLDGNWQLFNHPLDFRYFEQYEEFKPRYIFFVHWSWLVPEEVYTKYECIGFHIGDLPCGRGGSPVQNRILDGDYHTKITAFRIGEGIDKGDIYLKRNICLNGGAEEIYLRAADIIFDDMIPTVIKDNPTPIPQDWEGYESKRRTPEQSAIPYALPLNKVYDFIRMLDAETYPPAFIEYEGLRIEFTRPSLKHECIIADVKITEVRE